MGTINVGNQFVSYSFQEQLTSPNFNLGLKNIIKPGFYSPTLTSICTHTAGNVFTLNPFTIWIQGTNAGAVSIATTVAITIPNDVSLVAGSVNSATPIFYATWTSSANNSTYLDFGFCATVNSIPTNGICICTCLFTGSNLTGFDYTYTTIGAYTPTGECLNGYYQNANTSNSTIVLRDGTGNIQGSQLQSTVAQGTSPLTATSNTLVTNLNSQYFSSMSLETSLSGDTLHVPRSDAVKNYSDSYFMKYDYIVSTQAKFDAMIADGTWLNSKNVLFTTNVTHSGYITIPISVEKIHGVNGATIAITGLINENNGFGYQSLPTDSKYELVNMKITASGTGNLYTCANMLNVKNCTATCSGGNNHSFAGCSQMIGCIGTSDTGPFSYGFFLCNYLTGCTGTGSGSGASGNGMGFHSCTYLQNCVGNGLSGLGISTGFYESSFLTNCLGTATSNVSGATLNGFNSCQNLTNCKGITTAPQSSCTAYGIGNCSNISNCTGIGVASSNAIGIGINGCTQVMGCQAQGTGSQGYGFSACRKCIGNKAYAASTTSTYGNSYADAGTSYPCADNFAGGFNS